MPVPLNKTITRWAKIRGEDYKLILEPTRITLTKKGARDSEGTILLEDLLELLITGLKSTKSDRYDSISYKEILSRLGKLHVEMAGQIREIVDDIYEVNCLASDLSDEELVKRGIDPLD